MRYALILDRAHGKNVPGKQSPDGKFKEWEWSRDTIEGIIQAFGTMALPFQIFAPTLYKENEPGLSTRVSMYNHFIRTNFDRVLCLSIHVDYFDPDKTDKRKWWDGTGFSFFTSRENNYADTLANIMGDIFQRDMPDEQMRFNGPGDVSKDKNFTVIAGTKYVKPLYHGILVENLFMNNKDDIKKLTDPEWNTNLQRVYMFAILEMFRNMGCSTILPEITAKP